MAALTIPGVHAGAQESPAPATAVEVEAGFSIQIPEGGSAPIASNDGFWRRLEAPNAGPSYLFELDRVGFEAKITLAPLEFSQEDAAAPTIVTLPLPDGSFQRFIVEQAPIMERALAEKFPQLRTYSLKGIDAPTYVGRMDTNPRGLHAMVLTDFGVVLINPDNEGGGPFYRSWIDRVTTPEIDGFCGVTESDANGSTEAPQSSADGQISGRRTALANPSGDVLRTYRLAVATTGEYYIGRNMGGGDADVLASVVTVVNRLTLVYEVEVAIRFLLIGGNNLLLFSNPATDGYTNGATCTMRNENTPIINATLPGGSGDYDVGHVFGTGGGGCAGGSVVCTANNKGNGASGLNTTVPPGQEGFGGYRLVAHEMGHQFSAGHTWSGSNGSCSAGQFSASNAYEPLSGTTLMAYAGICGADDITGGPDDPYFHTRSFDQIVGFSTGGGGNACAGQIVTGNNVPVVDAGIDYTIPTQTPFTLTGSATDADGQPLTYDWEQFDLAPGRISPLVDQGDNPLFRSFLPVTTPSRTFPQLSDILSGTTTLGELLPTTERMLNFRLTARDNQLAGGGVDWDAMTVTTEGDPFFITLPNGGETLLSACTATVAWVVGGGSVAPTVDIMISTDGGNTFSTILASTPNDGEAEILVPSTLTSTARIKVQAVGNVFFDISDGDFAIEAGFGITIPGDVAFDDTCVGEDSTETLDVCNTGGGCENLEVDTITSSSPQFSVTEPISGYPVVISPDFCFPFQVVFSPTSAGDRSGTLTIPSNDPANPSTQIEATGTGTEPGITTLMADDGEFGDVCVGDFRDLDLIINNSGGCDLTVSNITSDSSEFHARSVSPPLVIAPGTSLAVPIRFEPADLGPENATITISSDAPGSPSEVNVMGNAPPADIDTVMADGGDFGNVCIGDFRDLDLTINNSGDCDLTVINITSNDASFETAGVMSFPLVIGPGDSLPVPIRFEPSSLGPHNATITISSDDPDTLMKEVAVSGNAPPGDITVTGSTDFGDVCAEELAEKIVNVCNTGLCNLEVLSASVDCPDFTLINNPFPNTVSHDFCLDLTVRFTPTSAGPKICNLTITSDDPDTPVVILELTANTPFASIDIPPDVSFPPTVVQNIDACQSLEPFPVSNTGICNLEITDLGFSAALGGGPLRSLSSATLTEGTAEEFFLAGLPSFPIILEPGHIAGSGDLSVGFAPLTIDRDRVDDLTVTYVSDPITGETITVGRSVCGEGVNTGARVLVTHNGVPLELVKMIKLRRMTGNNNQGPTDTVDTVQNAVVQTVTPESPCGPFQYHREYGTVSNPILLVPGSYLVTVKAQVPGMNGFQHQTVGFDLSSCDFNPTVIVDF